MWSVALLCFLITFQMSCRAKGKFNVTVPAPPKISIFKNASESTPQVSVIEDSTEIKTFTIPFPPEAFEQNTSQGVVSKTCEELLTVSSSDETMVLSSNIQVSAGVGGCQVAFIPLPNASGTFILVATSKLDPTDHFNIPVTIEGINDPPVVLEINPMVSQEDVPTTIALPLADDTPGLACTDAVLASSSNSNLLPSANIKILGAFPNCQLSYTPVAEQSGSAEITLVISDGQFAITKTVLVTVAAVNDPPLIFDVANQNTLVNTPFNTIAVSISDAETSLLCSNIAVISSNPTLIPVGNVISGAAPNCLLNFLPATGQLGTSTITLTVSDGTLSASDTFVLTVNSPSFVNSTPTNLSLSNTNLSENAGAMALVGNLSTTDPDINDTFIYSLVAGAGSTDNASFTIAGNQLRMTASANFEAKSFYNILVRATDQGNLFIEKPFTIAISNINEAPTIAVITKQSTPQDTDTQDIAVNISDVDGPAGACNSTYLSYSSQNSAVVATTGAVKWSGSWPNCVAVFTPEAGANGIALISITASDGSLLGVAQSFNLQVGIVPTGWYGEAYLKASNANANDVYGNAVSISADTAIVGAVQEFSNQTAITNGTSSSTDNSSFAAGASYIYRRSGSMWAQEAYVKASNANAGDLFGKTVSISGNTAIVGAYTESSNQTTITNGVTSSADNTASQSGAAYIFRRTGTNWAQEAYLKASNANARDDFGGAVSISGDTAIVGAHQESSAQSVITNNSISSSDNTASNSGSSYIYKRTGSTWVQEAYLKASNTRLGYRFGFSVALSGDTAVVGSDAEASNQITITNGSTSSTDNTVQDSGAGYIFKRTGFHWAQEAYLKASNANSGDFFASSVAISGDTVAVGAYAESSPQTSITNGTADGSAINTAPVAGATYIYKRIGSNWVQEAYLKASNANSSDRFGITVSLSGDTALVGADWESSDQTVITNDTTSSAINTATHAGASYVFKRTGSIWTQEAYLKASNANANDMFGGSVSISGDSVIVGAANEASGQTTITNGPTSSSDNTVANAGSAYIYRNLSRMFEVYEISSTVTSTSFGVSWKGTNLGSAIGNFKVVYGTTTPMAYCNSGTIAYEGSATSVSVTSGLVAGQSYILRICTFDGTNYSEGVTTGLTVKGDDIGPTVLSITRGTTSDPVPWGTSQIDYIVTFSEPVFNLQFENFSFSEVNSSNGATARVASISCTGAVCTVWVMPGNAGQLRLDLTNTSWAADRWGNPLPNTKLGDETYTLQGWAQEAYLKASNPSTTDNFGNAVAISWDTAIVGAPGEDSSQTTITPGITSSVDVGAVDSGAAYIYKRTGSFWAQEAFIKASNANTLDNFGTSVSISGDTALVGANFEGSGQSVITNGTDSSLQTNVSSAGAGYIYRRTGSQWAQEAYLKASNAGNYDQYGFAISLSGNTAVIGSKGEASDQNTIINGTTSGRNKSINTLLQWTDSGASYIYKRIGSTWSQEAFLKASNANNSDQFGFSVSISGDTVIVGSPFEDSVQSTITNGTIASTDNSATNAGASYIFKRTGITWAQEAYLKASNANGSATASDFFGIAVSVSGDTVIVGANYESSNQTIITNGTTSSSDNSATASGASYIFKRNGSFWDQQAYLKASNSDSSDRFGSSVAVSGNTALVGAPNESSNQTTVTNGTTPSLDNSALNAGASYIFKRTGSTWVQEAYLKASNANASDIFGSSVSLSGDTVIIGANKEASLQTTISNGTTSSNDNSATAGAGAVYVYRSLNRLFDPDLRISAKSANSITLSWGRNLGNTTQVKIAPAVTGNTTPLSCSDANAILLTPGVTSYTYSGLTASTKYGFRVCAIDGTQVSEGAIIRGDTD